MKISGYTITRNAVKFNYPVLESIQSILPICDEFIVNVGDSEDETFSLIESLRSSKIRILKSKWDMAKGKEVLSEQTNLALKECTGDWAFYLQSDEVIHEKDLYKLKKLMADHFKGKRVDSLRFQWFHFYGSYFRYRVDAGWYQKQDRIIRNNGEVESFGDAFGFKRKDGKELRHQNTGCYVYHYGWVHPEDVMAKRIVNARDFGFVSSYDSNVGNRYSYGDLTRFPIYFGSHPSVMHPRIIQHPISQADLKEIHRRYWWFPPKIFRIRYKTGKRIKQRIK